MSTFELLVIGAANGDLSMMEKLVLQDKNYFCKIMTQRFEQTKSDYKLQTLLHIAAKYGYFAIFEASKTL